MTANETQRPAPVDLERCEIDGVKVGAYGLSDEYLGGVRVSDLIADLRATRSERDELQKALTTLRHSAFEFYHAVTSDNQGAIATWGQRALDDSEKARALLSRLEGGKR